MSNYSRIYDFSVKDTLPTGDANKLIKGSEIDDEYDAIVVANNSKADKITSGTTSAYIRQDSNGNLVDSGVVITAYIDTLLDDTTAAAARQTLTGGTNDLTQQTSSTGSVILPVGTTAQRDGSPSEGYMRENSDTNLVEVYNGTSWINVGGTADVITTRGDIIRGDSSGDPERFALGTAGQVLISDGTDITYGSSVTKGTEKATTSGSSVSWTSLPSWIEEITLVFNEVSLSGSGYLEVTIGDSGGLHVTGYTSSSGEVINGANPVVASSGAEFNIRINEAARSFTGHMTITRVGTGFEYISSHTGRLGNTRTVSGGGVVTLDTVLTQIQVAASANNFDGGSIGLLYK